MTQTYIRPCTSLAFRFGTIDEDIVETIYVPSEAYVIPAQSKMTRESGNLQANIELFIC